MFGLLWQKSSSAKSKKGYETHSLTKEEYFDKTNYPRTIVSLLNIVAPKKGVISNTSATINFRGVEFGASVKEARQILGKPNLHAHKGMEVDGHEILFYNSSIGSVRVTQCLHFIDGHFILGQTIIRRPTQDQYKAFAEKVLEKYDLYAEGMTLADLEAELPVCDLDRNRIELSQAFHLTINYVSGDPKAMQALESIRDQRNSKRSSAKSNFREQVANFI
ncbi:hypothetical protein EFA69_02150 [Rufibacter immobilis]|uniref:Uncharacterized protein n=1 Tax=Rufibacter immobilis TaxID=1348778 RepID=A0A3M9N782_9BACT|nr:hypothetical protein [Rufibacter immobilis]RNI33235.1 hypothetical protein EFA69_02150 [Rufibacter immobilis]